MRKINSNINIKVQHISYCTFIFFILMKKNYLFLVLNTQNYHCGFLFLTKVMVSTDLLPEEFVHLIVNVPVRAE